MGDIDSAINHRSFPRRFAVRCCHLDGPFSDDASGGVGLTWGQHCYPRVGVDVKFIKKSGFSSEVSSA